jgi:hypothetical protein
MRTFGRFSRHVVELAAAAMASFCTLTAAAPHARDVDCDASLHGVMNKKKSGGLPFLQEALSE